MKNRRKFLFEGAVVPMQRPRTAKNGHVYVPNKTKECEALIRDAYLKQYASDEPLEGAIKIEITIFRHMTKAIAKDEEKISSVQWHHLLPTTKPDLSNMIKTVEDALNGCAYKDDAQITDIVAHKRYCNFPSESDYCRIVITPISQG